MATEGNYIDNVTGCCSAPTSAGRRRRGGRRVRGGERSGPASVPAGRLTGKRPACEICNHRKTTPARPKGVNRNPVRIVGHRPSIRCSARRSPTFAVLYNLRRGPDQFQPPESRPDPLPRPTNVPPVEEAREPGGGPPRDRWSRTIERVFVPHDVNVTPGCDTPNAPTRDEQIVGDGHVRNFTEHGFESHRGERPASSRDVRARQPRQTYRPLRRWPAT